MSDSEKPPLRVVAKNTQAEIDRGPAQHEVDRTLIILAANILRVVRGAGKPDEVIEQCVDVVNAAIEFQDKTGGYLSSYAVADAILLKPEKVEDYESFHANRQWAIESMVSGSLQYAASRLLDQQLHIQKGERELMSGFRQLEEIYQEARMARLAAEKAARSSSSRKPVKKPKAAKKKPVTL
ncbi:hypothetical protein [Rhizobium sp. L245/93]|uniref:hypothetical protein n=1 Tax=Rhizobium sp. L245/93 TaxID=2819998 RepID=UPI001ADD2BE7|nr:hypothetical protein [Rhizobium sp. L245/93]MBO9168426.1 hypothetical protein [Rhizobium sp. L245/93]